MKRATLVRYSGAARAFSTQRALLQEETKKLTEFVSHVESTVVNQESPKTLSVAEKVAAQIIDKKRERAKALASLKGDIKIKPLSQIVKEGRQRYEERFIKPTRKWSNNLKRKVPDFDQLQTEGKKFFNILDENLPKAKRTVSATDLFEPLDIGDAIDLSLSLNQSALAVIVEVPSSDDDPRYTIMNKLGELTYLERSAVKFRIPQLIPKEWLKDIIYRIEGSSASDYGSIKTTLEHYETYAVSSGARSFAIRPLVEVTNSAWAQIQKTSRKLEFIHRLLQTDGPREVSLFTLLKAVHHINLNETKDTFKGKDFDSAYETLSQELFEKLGDLKRKDGEIDLGKEYGNLSTLDHFDVSTFYSVVLALRKQSNLWSTSYSSRATLVPLSVTVLPIDYANRVEYAADLLKSEPLLMKSFEEYVESKDYTHIPEELEPIFFLLREFSVGNLKDPKSVTLVCQLMKLSTKDDINQTVVYNFLSNMDYINTHMTNPYHFTTSLCLPNTGVSNKATIEQLYFELNDVKRERENDLAKERKDYKDLRVFCIDADTAHEIDDGVSIERLGSDDAILHIHVADPASYMTKESPLTKIAFERAFTTYQPEMISPMLPQSMSQLAGLGVDGRKTRALTFSVPFKMSTGEFDLGKSQVQATLLSNFPKYTYDDVDEVLAKIKGGELKLENPEHRDLQDLFEASQKLREGRVRTGAVIFGESLSAQVRVTEIVSSSELDDNVEVNISKQKATDSVLLVSELMILGNRIAANILSRHSVGGIYKGMTKLNLTGSAAEVVPRLNEYTKTSSELPSLSDIVKSFKFIVPAFYSCEPTNHLMLGVDKYAPSTSPLRRFGDLTNHFQFHHILNGEKPLFSEDEILPMTLHIEARNDILRKASRGALAYYSIKQLEAKFNAGEIDMGNFMVTSRALDGIVFGQLVDHGIMTRMKVSTNKKPPAIGDVLQKFEIVDFDSVGGMLNLKQLDD